MSCRPALLVAAAAVLSSALALAAPPTTLTIDTARPGIKVSPTLYGIFFEDISRSVDGGIYAELIQNRSFEDSADAPAAWALLKPDGVDASVAVDTSKPLNDANPRSLRLDVRNVPAGARAAIANEGFHGVPVRAGAAHTLTLSARAAEQLKSPVVATLESRDGKVLARADLPAVTTDWQSLTATLTPDATDPAARLVLSVASPGTLFLDMVSLFPAETWKNRGLRPDLLNFLDKMKPTFVRFPGGCWVEGETMATAYRWKNTVGPVDRRRTVYNLWRYHATNGVGYHEYLQMCEDLGAAPMFVVNCGMSHREVVPLDRMGEYVQDALDAIEYANGDTSTKWGALRAANGHPAPFNLKYVQIGNENGHQPYDERYTLFYDAIKAKYPDIQLISCYWGGTKPKTRPIEILDEHYYDTPQFFIDRADMYDAYDRTSYKVYVGEFAVTRGAVGRGNLRAAVAEAAFMTGMERNSDVVVMSSYAPLYAHVRYTAWNPNAINFDNARSYGTPSYYAQQMFARNRADVILPLDIAAPASPPKSHPGRVGFGTWDTQAEFRDVKVEQGGRVLYRSSDKAGLPDNADLSGTWQFRGGVARQTSNAEGAFVVLGDPTWADYTLSLKARKLSGSEGFLVRFASTGDDDYAMWNIGGWRNSRTAVELSRGGGKTVVSGESPVTVEPDRWYDIRIETSVDRVKCYLDEKLIHDFAYPKTRPLYGVAGKSGNDIVLKVANVSPDPQPVRIDLANLAFRPAPTATVTTLTSASPDDENTLDAPTKVAPRTSRVDVAGTALGYTFAPNSVTVVRIATKP